MNQEQQRAHLYALTSMFDVAVLCMSQYYPPQQNTGYRLWQEQSNYAQPQSSYPLQQETPPSVQPSRWLTRFLWILVGVAIGLALRPDGAEKWVRVVGYVIGDLRKDGLIEPTARNGITITDKRREYLSRSM
jgi:hypothetical protein